jgi:cytochrome c-type biogenesis protein CcmH/NrfG
MSRSEIERQRATDQTASLQQVIKLHSEHPEVVAFLDRRIAHLMLAAQSTLSWAAWNQMSIWEQAMRVELRPTERRGRA